MSRYKFFSRCNGVWCISFFILLSFLNGNNFGCLANEDFSDDPGADTTGNEATNDQLDHDPNVVNPQKNAMSGNNVPISIMDNLSGRSIALLQ